MITIDINSLECKDWREVKEMCEIRCTDDSCKVYCTNNQTQDIENQKWENIEKEDRNNIDNYAQITKLVVTDIKNGLFCFLKSF